MHLEHCVVGPGGSGLQYGGQMFITLRIMFVTLRILRTQHARRSAQLLTQGTSRVQSLRSHLRSEGAAPLPTTSLWLSNAPPSCPAPWLASGCSPDAGRAVPRPIQRSRKRRRSCSSLLQHALPLHELASPRSRSLSPTLGVPPLRQIDRRICVVIWNSVFARPGCGFGWTSFT
jgi:hypothetical protein